MRRLARAWWAGTRRETVTVLVRRWECVVRERNKRRVVALAAMAASAQTAIVRRVWLELVGQFWVDSRGEGGGGCEMEVEVERGRKVVREMATQLFTTGRVLNVAGVGGWLRLGTPLAVNVSGSVSASVRQQRGSRWQMMRWWGEWCSSDRWAGGWQLECVAGWVRR